MNEQDFAVAIVGGGATGLSAALVLGRGRWRRGGCPTEAEIGRERRLGLDRRHVR